MKLSVDRKALAAALRTVTKAVPRVTGLAAITGVHLDAAPQGLRLTCTDLDLTITTRIDAVAEEPGVVLVPATSLAKIVAKLDADTVTIVGVEDLGVTVAGDRTVADLPTLHVKEWPKLPEVEGTAVQLGPEHVADLRRIQPFSSLDYTRAGLTGIVFDDGEIRATNSYNGAVIAWPTLTVEHAANVPASGVAAVLADADPEAYLELTLTENHAAFEAGDTRWIIRQLAEPGPQMKHLFRDSSNHHLAVDVAAWSTAIDTVATLDRNEPVSIHVVDGVATFTSSVIDVGAITTTAPVEDDLDLPFGFAVNSKWFLEVITVPGVETVTLEIVDHLKPIQVDAGGARALVMPVRK